VKPLRVDADASPVYRRYARVRVMPISGISYRIHPQTNSWRKSTAVIETRTAFAEPFTAVTMSTGGMTLSWESTP
jgi:hypothetical protein